MKGNHQMKSILKKLVTLAVATVMAMGAFVVSPVKTEVYADDEVVAMYRLYNPNTGEHFYTGATDERDNVLAAGWSYEGIGWYAPSEGKPVYRLYNSYGSEHHYTLDKVEKDMLVRVGWSYEGIGWYSADRTNEAAVPIHREYNPNEFSNNHNYTANLDEHNFLITVGWRDEGIAWYGVN